MTAPAFASDLEAQRLALHYARRLGDTLGLRDWTLELRPHPPEDAEALATCTPVTGRRYAVLRFCAHFPLLTPAEQRETVVHELLHLHFERLAATLQTLDALDLARPDVEYAVDALTAALAPRMPLPAFSNHNPEVRREQAVA